MYTHRSCTDDEEAMSGLRSAILTNALLLVLFVAQHSLMACKWLKDVWNSFGPSAISRLIYVFSTCCTIQVSAVLVAVFVLSDDMWTLLCPLMLTPSLPLLSLQFLCLPFSLPPSLPPPPPLPVFSLPPSLSICLFHAYLPQPPCLLTTSLSAHSTFPSLSPHLPQLSLSTTSGGPHLLTHSGSVTVSASLSLSKSSTPSAGSLLPALCSLLTTSNYWASNRYIS